MESNAALSNALHLHLETFFPRRKIESFVWTVGPIQSTIPAFRVLRIAPDEPGQPWIYVSDGAASIKGLLGEQFEFFILARDEDPVHVESLAMVANFHSDDRYQVDVGRIVDIGRSWVDGSHLTHFLVSLPYPFGPQFEHFNAGHTEIRILWLLPISREEAHFAKTEGVEALEQRLDECAIDSVDIYRASVI